MATISLKIRLFLLLVELDPLVRLLQEDSFSKAKKLIIFSRDEMKQWHMEKDIKIQEI